jgi:hypothetical protein
MEVTVQVNQYKILPDPFCGATTAEHTEDANIWIRTLPHPPLIPKDLPSARHRSGWSDATGNYSLFLRFCFPGHGVK